jgi:hypothetical protein
MWRANRKKIDIETCGPDKDYIVLIPFWGNVNLLSQLGWASQYEDRILICTTDKEKPATYQAIEELGLNYIKLNVGSDTSFGGIVLFQDGYQA